MAEENNNNNTPDITELIKSLQAESASKPDIGGEGFPFSQEFDIDAFVAANDQSSEVKAEVKKNNKESLTEVSAASAEFSADAASAEDFDITENDDSSIRSLEDQIADLESRLSGSSASKGYSLSDDDLDLQEIGGLSASKEANAEAFPQMDDFYKNIANTIGTLKDSLEGMTKRVQSEQTARIQEKNLINRLRDKTTQLKAINLTLNTEVKKAKGEKLEALRQNAQKTKELLSMRVQLAKVEEKAKHGDFKLSRLEQQLSVVSEQKKTLDEEVTSIREEKLKSLRHSLQQTKEIMALRMELAKTEEKFKIEEVNNTRLKEQLTSVEQQQKALSEELFTTKREREEAARQNTQYISSIETLKQQIAYSEEKLLEEAASAGSLKENILSLETQMQVLMGEKTSLMVKLDERARDIEVLRSDFQKQIDTLKQAQLAEIEQLKSQKQQEADSITLELKRSEDKYRQEELFVNTLKMQITSLQGDVKNLAEQKQSLEGKATDLAHQIDAIKEAHNNEINNLKNELNSALEKFEKEKSAFNSLKEQLALVENEKQTLIGEIKALVAVKDDALAQNQHYLNQIESIKKEHADIEADLKRQMQAFRQSYEEEKASVIAQKDNAISSKNKEIEDIRSSKEQQKQALENEKNQIFAELESLKAAGENQKQNFVSEISSLKKSLSERNSVYEENASLKQQLNDKQHYLSQAGASLQEKERTLEALKGDIANLNGEKVLIEAEFKKASDQLYKTLTNLEAKTKELEAFQQNHHIEVQALKEEKARELSALENKYNLVQDRLKAEEETSQKLKAQIADLENQRLSAERQAGSIKEEYSLSAKAMAAHAEEILTLKSKLAKSEGRSLQDMALAEQLKEKAALAEAAKEMLEHQLFELQKENTALKLALNDKAHQIEALKAVLAQTEENLKQEQETVKQLQEYTVRLKAVNSALDREVRKVQQEKVTALRKSAEQAQEILALKEQLVLAGSASGTLSFENGIISLRKEYEAKVERLETELKDASALCAKQVQEIQSLQTDNETLKLAEQEKIKLQAEFETLSNQAKILEKELAQYRLAQSKESSSLVQAKFAALNAQVAKINKDKTSLQQQLGIMQAKIAELEEGETKSATAFNTLKAQINTNDAVIEKLKREIIKLTAENNDLKDSAQISVRRQQVLEAKISEVESENQTLTGTLRLNKTQPPSAAEKQKEATFRAQPVKITPYQEEQPKSEKEKTLTQAPSKTLPVQKTITQPSAKITKKDIMQNPVLDYEVPDTETEIEVVDVEGEQMDLSMIFGEETFRDDAPEAQGLHTVEENTLKPRTLKTGLPSSKTRSDLPSVTMEEDPFDQFDATDHSPNAHRLIRKPVGRVPQSYRSEAYSDFLKKTKSVFFRIKWSVFKD